ncbi:MAG: hypothetical protein E7397_07165 [Ruminococcaceae bacterium]|nr:hypothetical protein [Oscillospiraceae bacterium]
MNKVALILLDGLRPDALALCKNPYIQELLKNSLHTLAARTVFPSVTLPCHMSLFHSVDPMRHGVTTNIYTPQVRPVNGIVEQVGPTKTAAMIYDWEELRDLSRPGNMLINTFFSGKQMTFEKTAGMVGDASIRCIQQMQPDFIFIYMGWPDSAGHGHGWMGEEYIRSVEESFKQVEKIINTLPEEYLAIVTADHGGHDRIHGTDLDEDMLIPVILKGKDIEPGILEHPVSILDIAPTVTKVLGCENAPEWEGTSLL